MNNKKHLGLRFKQIHDSFVCDFNRNLRSLDLTMSQMSILAYLFEHTDTLTMQRDLEQFFQLSHPTVIGILQRMEKKGLIQSVVNADDRRCRNVLLTEKALAIRSAMDIHHEEMEARLTRGMTDYEIHALSDLLDRVCKNLADS